MQSEQKYEQVKSILAGLGRTVVAYSGGVDSTLLLRLAVDQLGADNVLACISVSPSLSRSQYELAVRMAKQIGARLQEVKTDELSDNEYSANKADRCFHCKSKLYKELVSAAEQAGYEAVVCGSNADDLSDYRPGNRAAQVFGVRAPLAEAGLSKQEVRELSRRLGLPTADMPASPCLASRISYGLEITAEKLRQVEQAEDFLRELGFIEFRVRHHDTIARIEVGPQDMEKLVAEPMRTRIAEKLNSLGFKYVTLDLVGFRSGSLNEMLTEAEKRNGE